ncbi:GGDEF domain-containing protein, partial [Thiobacillus sp.]
MLDDCLGRPVKIGVRSSVASSKKGARAELLDLDRFKKISDTLGHEAGDDALRKFVQIVRRNLREQDFLARTGGNEFRLLLPGTPQSWAIVLAEKI